MQSWSTWLGCFCQMWCVCVQYNISMQLHKLYSIYVFWQRVQETPRFWNIIGRMCITKYDNISDLVSNHEKAHTIARDRLQKRQVYLKKHHDKTVLSQKLHVGACVYLFYPAVSPWKNLANYLEDGKVLSRFLKWALFHVRWNGYLQVNLSSQWFMQTDWNWLWFDDNFPHILKFNLIQKACQ